MHRNMLADIMVLKEFNDCNDGIRGDDDDDHSD